ncbi:MAG: sigma 54-interacting transcriptional regulator, partial [Desulfobacterales bacterium]|nr:sigma 54-interacting transcriptional regulator [Desulfobacterales bacterium]
TTLKSQESGEPILNKTSFYRTSTDVITSSQYSTYPYYDNRGRVAGSIIFNTDVQTSSLLFSAFSEGMLSCLPPEIYPKRPRFTFDALKGNDYLFLQCIDQASAASSNNMPVMIWGESGTGKELFAQSIHNNSGRRENPFIPINCAAIPEHLLEGILFGTSKGAFTDAREKKGLLEAANGGTVLLDELNSMSLNLQAKLLRAIQEKKIRRIGSLDEVHIDLKVISTLNVPPREALAKRLIRQDLFYRLAVIMITVPPLRERKNDIPLLSDYFLKKHEKEKQLFLSKDVYELFLNHTWPGNVRELENTIQSAIIFCGRNKLITPDHLSQYFLESCAEQKNPTPKSRVEETANAASEAPLPPVDHGGPITPDGGPQEPLKKYLLRIEREYVEKTLKQTGGNVARAARILGMTPPSLHYKIKKYGFDPGR